MIIARPESGQRLDSRQLQTAREAQAADGQLAKVAAELGCSSEEEALVAVGEALGLEVVDLTKTDLDLTILDDFPLKLIHRLEVFPIRREAGSLVVATGNPFDLNSLDAVSAATVSLS